MGLGWRDQPLLEGTSKGLALPLINTEDEWREQGLAGQHKMFLSYLGIFCCRWWWMSSTCSTLLESPDGLIFRVAAVLQLPWVDKKCSKLWNSAKSFQFDPNYEWTEWKLQGETGNRKSVSKYSWIIVYESTTVILELLYKLVFHEFVANNVFVLTCAE